jgi:F0F1-type ATP synthase assembly protein I
MTVSNTNLLKGSLQNNFGSSPLKYQRINDIQDVVDDKYSHADGDEETTETEEKVEETKNAGSTQETVSTDEQAKDVAAKEHAPKNEPVRIMGVKLSHILIGAVVIGGISYGIYAYSKYAKNQN